MLDLVDLLNKKGSSGKGEKNEITTVLFYQTDECKNLVKEAFRFEGLDEPVVLANDDLSISDHVRQQTIEIVVIELNRSSNISKDAERISHLLPSHASVIVIGSEDAISTIRNLKAMGFYYLYWPVTKEEFIDFVKSVSDNRLSKKGLGQSRKAKRIVVVGAKGGVGATLLSSEIAYLLSSYKKSTCVLADHNYYNSNLDVMMGLTEFERHEVAKGASLTALDLTSARGLLIKRNEKLSVLSLTSNELTRGEMHDYSQSVLQLLSEDVNFIVEDLSASALDIYSESRYWLESDCIILLMSRVVSSVRESARILAMLNGIEETKRPRIILVVNNTIPEKFATVDMNEIESFLKTKPQIEIPFMGATSQEVLKGKRLSEIKNSKVAQALNRLVSLILGEDVEGGKRILSIFSKK